MNNNDHFILYNDKGTEIGDLAKLTDEDLNMIGKNGSNTSLNAVNQDNDVTNVPQDTQNKNKEQTADSDVDATVQKPKRKFGIRK